MAIKKAFVKKIFASTWSSSWPVNITLDDKFLFINHCLNSLTLLLGNSPAMTSNLIVLDLSKLYLEILPIFFFAFLFCVFFYLFVCVFLFVICLFAYAPVQVGNIFQRRYFRTLDKNPPKRKIISVATDAFLFTFCIILIFIFPSR